MNALQQAQFAPNYGGFQQAQIPQSINQSLPNQVSPTMQSWPTSQTTSGLSFQGPNSMALATSNLSSIFNSSSPVDQTIMLFDRMVAGLSRILEQLLPGGVASLLGVGGSAGPGIGAIPVTGLPSAGNQAPLGQVSSQQGTNPNQTSGSAPTADGGTTGFKELLGTWGEFLRNEEAVDTALTAAGKLPVIGGALDSTAARWGASALGEVIGWFV